MNLVFKYCIQNVLPQQRSRQTSWGEVEHLELQLSLAETLNPAVFHWPRETTLGSLRHVRWRTQYHVRAGEGRGCASRRQPDLQEYQEGPVVVPAGLGDYRQDYVRTERRRKTLSNPYSG